MAYNMSPVESVIDIGDARTVLRVPRKTELIPMDEYIEGLLEDYALILSQPRGLPWISPGVFPTIPPIISRYFYATIAGTH